MQKQIQGENYSTKVDLSKFLHGTVYPALEKHLDLAFPEFSFERSPHGYWVARSTPVSYSGYGYSEGRLIARGWGFRTSRPGMPGVTWLAYVNKRHFPRGQTFVQVVRTLASKVEVTSDDWNYSEEEILKAEMEERRDRFLEAFFAFAHGQLYGPEGGFARNYLTKVIGLPPNQLHEYDIGFYTSTDDARDALRQSGFDQPEDTNRGEVLGLFHPRWEGRIVGPWWDIKGEKVINIWGRFPGPTPLDQDVYINLFRPDPNQPFGSRDIPLGLHHARRLNKPRLVVLESPVKALLAYSLGMVDPFPVASGGIPTAGQAAELTKHLRRNGSVCFNLDFFPGAKDPHARTVEAIRNFREVSFGVYAIDPIEMAGTGSYAKEMCPASYIRANGIQGYRALVSKRVPATSYLSQANVLEYHPQDRTKVETPKELLESVESFIDDLDVQQRSSGVDMFRDPAYLASMHHQDGSPPAAAQRVDPKDTEGVIPEITSLLASLGETQLPDSLRAELAKLGIQTGVQRVAPEEAAAKAPPPASINLSLVPPEVSAAGTNRRNIDAMVSNIQKGFEKLAADIRQGEISPDQAILIILKCQDGIRAMLSALL
jgi:hypothetical protein